MINNTASPNDLVSTLLVFSTYPYIVTDSLLSAS